MAKNNPCCSCEWRFVRNLFQNSSLQKDKEEGEKKQNQNKTLKKDGRARNAQK